jgi:hypothetical protein
MAEARRVTKFKIELEDGTVVEGEGGHLREGDVWDGPSRTTMRKRITFIKEPV